MRILILADQRTGHVRQCLGLVRQIERERPVDLVQLPVQPRGFAPDLVRRLVARWPGLSPKALLMRFYGLSAEEVSGFDLVIGSGRPTILAGLLISRLTSAKFAYLGRVPGYDPAAFDLILVPYRSEGDLLNHAFAPIPSPVNPDGFMPPRELRTLETLKDARLTLLVGGPSSRRNWSMRDWAHLGYFLIASEHELGISWSVATSPRTPEAGRGVLAGAFSLLEKGGEFVDFHVAGPGSADHLLEADAICVTSDSTSMIAEGLAAMRPVIGIATRGLKVSRDERLLADLAEAGHFADLPLASLTPASFARTLMQLTTPTTDPRTVLGPLLAGVLPAQN